MLNLGVMLWYHHPLLKKKQNEHPKPKILALGYRIYIELES
jgi:hypothetical protein